MKGLSEKQRAIYDDPSSNIDALFNGRANYDEGVIRSFRNIYNGSYGSKYLCTWKAKT